MMESINFDANEISSSQFLGEPDEHNHRQITVDYQTTERTTTNET